LSNHKFFSKIKKILKKTQKILKYKYYFPIIEHICYTNVGILMKNFSQIFLLIFLSTLAIGLGVFAYRLASDTL
jgi:hypothetical protein